MIIQNVLVGSKQVEKIYIGSNLVWEWFTGEPIVLYGVSASESYTSSIVGAFVLLPFSGELESVSYGDSDGNALPVTSLTGIGEYKSHTPGKGYVFAALVSGTNEESEIYSDTIAHIFRCVAGFGESESNLNAWCEGHAFACASGSSTFVHINHTKALADAFKRALMYAKEKSQSYCKAEGSAWKMAPFGGLETNYSFSDAIGRAFDIVSSHTASESSSYYDAIGRPFPVVETGGVWESDSFAEAVSHLFDALSTHGTAESESHGDGTAHLYTVINGQGEEESISHAEAEASLWYLPIESNGILEIRQAYDTVEDGDILEVI